jgi:recombinational DNA repair protein RecR
MRETLRDLLDLETAEAYALAVHRLGLLLPPLEALENEDWGRDLLMQRLQELPDERLAAVGLRRATDPEPP